MKIIYISQLQSYKIGPSQLGSITCGSVRTRSMFWVIELVYTSELNFCSTISNSLKILTHAMSFRNNFKFDRAISDCRRISVKLLQGIILDCMLTLSLSTWSHWEGCQEITWETNWYISGFIFESVQYFFLSSYHLRYQTTPSTELNHRFYDKFKNKEQKIEGLNCEMTTLYLGSNPGFVYNPCFSPKLLWVQPREIFFLLS